MLEKIRRTLDIEIKSISDEERTLEAVASDETKDRYRDIIRADGWDLKNFKKNPVLMFGHDYRQPPIGKVIDIGVRDKKLVFKAKFATAEEYPFADTIFKLYKGGYMKAFSVGFYPKEWKDLEDGGREYLKQELLEISAVPIPANPSAVTMAVEKGVISEEEAAEVFKGVIPYKKYPLADPDTPWDGPKEVAAADVAKLKKMCAWYDSEKPDVKSSYKLPHHRASDLYTVWRGVRAAMAALLGARGGVKIPESDRKGVYNHLAKHYRDFGKEPPEFKEYSEAELIGMELTWAIEDIEGKLERKFAELQKELDTRIDEVIKRYNDVDKAASPEPGRDAEPVDVEDGNSPMGLDEETVKGVVRDCLKEVLQKKLGIFLKEVS